MYSLTTLFRTQWPIQKSRMVQSRKKNYKVAAELGEKCRHLPRENVSASHKSHKYFEKNCFSLLFLPIKDEIAVGNGTLHYQNIKPELLILRVGIWLCAWLCRAKEIFLNPYGWIKKGNGGELTEGSLQLMIKSWCIFYKATNLRFTLKIRRLPRNTLMFFFLPKWENKDARQSTNCQLYLDDLIFQSLWNQTIKRKFLFLIVFNTIIVFPVRKYWVSIKTQKSFTNPGRQADYRLCQSISLSHSEITC